MQHSQGTGTLDKEAHTHGNFNTKEEQLQTFTKDKMDLTSLSPYRVSYCFLEINTFLKVA